ncbi:MAG: hypothetical protein P8Y45_22785 [Exilibacterium sp.]
MNNNPDEITLNTDALARKNLTTSLSSGRLDRNRKHFELLAGLGDHDGYCVPYTSTISMHKAASSIVSSTYAANRSGQRRCSPSRDRLRQGCRKRAPREGFTACFWRDCISSDLTPGETINEAHKALFIIFPEAVTSRNSGKK